MNCYDLQVSDELYQPDDFYRIDDLTVPKIKKILRWARDNCAWMNVDMLDCSVRLNRVSSDIDFNDLVDLVDKGAEPFFRIIIRKNMNLFGYPVDDREERDMLMIGIRSIEVDNKEYFIFIYMEVGWLDHLKGDHSVTII